MILRPKTASRSDSANGQPGSTGSADAVDRSLSSSDSSTYGEMLQTLRTALEQDGSGMHFNETARSLRSRGVFGNTYFDYVAQLADSADSEGERYGMSGAPALLVTLTFAKP